VISSAPLGTSCSKQQKYAQVWEMKGDFGVEKTAIVYTPNLLSPLYIYIYIKYVYIHIWNIYIIKVILF